MNSARSFDEVLNKAFLLACFIQGDRKTALKIVRRATVKLDVAAASQGKRLYYKPIGRHGSRGSDTEGFRNKVSFNEVHLLQRLIYIESEPYEIQREQSTNSIAPSDEELLIHFIKHLVRITIKRNSFYTTLGLGRLLYHYSTAETMEIYNAVIQDPDRVKDDYYFRSRKGVLMQEMKERFGDLLKISRGAHGEERFLTQEASGSFAETVEACLRAFTPWWTPCLVPGTDPVMDGIPQFSYQGHQEEDKIELNRIHAVLHPHCLDRLIRALGLKAPAENLAVPSFFFSNVTSNGGSNGLSHPEDLNEDELRSLKSDLEKQRERRKSASPRLLRVLVDGVEQGRLDLNEASSFDFEMKRDSELIEILACDRTGDEFLLATHLLNQTEENPRTQNASIILEGGQKVSVAVSRTQELSTSAVSVRYGNTNPLRAAALYLHQWIYPREGGSSGEKIWRGSPVLSMALICLLVGLSIAIAVLYVRRDSPSKDVVANVQPPGPTSASQNNSSSPHAENSLNPTGAQVAGVEPKPKPRISPADQKDKEKQTGAAVSVLPDNNTVSATEESSKADSTRSLAAGSAPASLSNVRKIYVTFIGNSPVNEQLQKSLIENLRASNRITISHSRSEADALMKVSLQRSIDGDPQKAALSVQLINGSGNIIWPTASTKSHGNYRGSVATLSRSVVEDLLEEIRLAK